MKEFDYKNHNIKRGSIVYCDECDAELYSTTTEINHGDMLVAKMFKGISVADPKDQEMFVCPMCRKTLLGLGGIRICS